MQPAPRPPHKKRLSRRLKHLLIAHKGNGYRPGLFARETAATIALILLLVEGVYLTHVNVLLKNEGFLATVLPAALTTLANVDRAAQGISPLSEDPALDKVAQAKANDMASKGYFAHVSPSGKTPWDWLDEAGYPYTYAGENLAVDFTESQDVETAWMNSPMHRANILKQQYTRVGIGVAQGLYQGKEVTFVAQFFAARRDDGVPAKRPVAVTASAAETPATVPAETRAEEPQVLGATVQLPAAAPAQHTAAVDATSPSKLMTYALVGFTAFIAFFLVLTLFIHQRRRSIEIEAIGGGILLLIVVAAIWLYNENTVSYVQTPSDGQQASVVAAL